MPRTSTAPATVEFSNARRRSTCTATRHPHHSAITHSATGSKALLTRPRLIIHGRWHTAPLLLRRCCAAAALLLLRRCCVRVCGGVWHRACSPVRASPSFSASNVSPLRSFTQSPSKAHFMSEKRGRKRSARGTVCSLTYTPPNTIQMTISAGPIAMAACGGRGGRRRGQRGEQRGRSNERPTRQHCSGCYDGVAGSGEINAHRGRRSAPLRWAPLTRWSCLRSGGGDERGIRSDNSEPPPACNECAAAAATPAGSPHQPTARTEGGGCE